MPTRNVVFFRDTDGCVPFIDWFRGLPAKAQEKCLARLERLALLGHELRRPEADYLRDDIYELRVHSSGINYRILYFFHGQEIVVLSHGMVKQRAEIPKRDIELAIQRRNIYFAASQNHSEDKDGLSS